MTPGNFLCGCSPEFKRGYSGDVISGPMGNEIYTDKRFDDEGYEVCPEHGARMYGWISHSLVNPHWEDASRGQRPVFKSPERSLKLSVKIGEDRRDNRDPEQVYAELRASRAKSNGH